MNSAETSSPVVLYVDDDPDDLFLVQRSVARSRPGFNLHAAVGMEAAIEYLAAPGNTVPVPVMIIIDYELKNFRATDLIRWLQDRPDCPQVPIVILSGRDDSTCVAHCYSTGADAFLHKPPSSDELAEIVRAIGSCVTAVSVEPLKKLPSYRACQLRDLRAALEQRGLENLLLRQRLLELRAKLDIARAEAKEEKRKFKYPRARKVNTDT